MRMKMNLMHKEEEQVLRFSRLNRGLHIVMIISFISLSLTGMSLKFSYTSWAVALSHFFGGFEATGSIHRFAASVMMVVFITHIIDITRIKRREISSWKEMIFGNGSMLFNKKDLEDFIGSMKWFWEKVKDLNMEDGRIGKSLITSQSSGEFL